MNKINNPGMKFILFFIFSTSLLIQVPCQSLIHQNLVVHIDSLTSISKKGRGITNGGANEAANYIRDVFSGEENYYHTPSDTKEHLNFTKMEALVDLLVGVLIGVDMP